MTPPQTQEDRPLLRVGVDLGGTKIEAVVLGEDGSALHRQRVLTPRDDYDATLGAIRDLVLGLEDRVQQSTLVGVGIPGTIVAATGLVKNANSTWLNSHALQADLSSALGREVRCSNDANCFTVSEATDGAAAGFQTVFGVILGTGCGGGLTVNGALHAGPNGLAGEWGHIPLPWPSQDEVPGPACYCGHNGCLETWISGTGFERDFERVSGQRWQGPQIIDAMRRGDPIARAAFERLRGRLARGLALVVNLLDPDVVVLGGGLSNVEELYDGALQQELSQWTFGAHTETPILRNRHGDSSGVRGAAWLWPADDTPHLG